MNKDFELFDKICKAIQAQDKKDEAFTEATKYVDLFENGFIYDTSSLVDCLVDIAESLFPEVMREILILVRNVEFAFVLESFDVGKAFFRIFTGNIVHFNGFGHDCFSGFGLIPADHVISDRISHVNRARKHIEHDIESFKLIAEIGRAHV